MSQRCSGYARIEGDGYVTPRWVSEALIPHLPRTPTRILEPASADGGMANALRGVAEVVEADISNGTDFLTAATAHCCDTIITNPPYKLAAQFIDRALVAMEANQGMVAMLLRTDFDAAKSRRYLFADCAILPRKSC
jgi:hypothetical protein